MVKEVKPFVRGSAKPAPIPTTEVSLTEKEIRMLITSLRAIMACAQLTAELNHSNVQALIQVPAGDLHTKLVYALAEVTK